MTLPAWALACGVGLAACNTTSRLPPDAGPARTVAAHLAALGERYARSGDLVRAEQYLAAALRDEPNNARVLHALLHVCVGGSRLRNAVEHAQAHLTRHPEAWRVRYLLACIELALGHRQRARSELLRVAQLEPRHPDTYYLLGTLDAGDRARELYARYLTLSPQGVYAFSARAALATPAAPSVAP
jgi:predicted Zn-dependent protease